MGFTAGIVIFELLPGSRKSKIIDIYKWMLIGCAVGGGVAFCFGPMLIVFGMFGLGTAAVGLREILRIKKLQLN